MYNNYRAYSSRNMYSNSKYNTTINNKTKIKNNFNRTNFNLFREFKEDKKNKIDIDNNATLFNILGFEVHFDDFLLLSILIFLYKEDIKDDYLFITLILLLLN